MGGKGWSFHQTPAPPLQFWDQAVVDGIRALYIDCEQAQTNTINVRMYGALFGW